MDINNVVENTAAQLVGRNACYYAIAAIGLNVQFGYTGLLNFGQAAFMAAGAYGLGHDGVGAGDLDVVGDPDRHRLLDLPRAADGHPDAAPARRLPRDRHDRGRRGDSPGRAVGQVPDQFGGTDGLKDFANSFQKVGSNLGLNPASTYGFWAFKFSGRDLWVLIVGWSLVGDLRRRRVAADAQPVGPRAQGDPRGRGRGAQPRQERVQLQDAGAHLRRRDRHLRRVHPARSARPTCSPTTSAAT